MPILKNARTAIIEPAKFVEYCLDPHHEDGRHKAPVFKAVLGFERTNHADLIAAIRRGILTQEAEYVSETAHGFLCSIMRTSSTPRSTPSSP